MAALKTTVSGKGNKPVESTCFRIWKSYPSNQHFTDRDVAVQVLLRKVRLEPSPKNNKCAKMHFPRRPF